MQYKINMKLYNPIFCLSPIWIKSRLGSILSYIYLSLSSISLSLSSKQIKRYSLLILTVIVTLIIFSGVVSAANDVPYLDENGTQKTANTTDLNSGGATTLNSGWYSVSGNVNYTGTLTIKW